MSSLFNNGFLIGALIGGLFGGIGGIALQWALSKQGSENYPDLLLDVPADAENSPAFQAWARQNGYVLRDGAYTKGRGWLTSATEIRFTDGKMSVQECVNLLFDKKRFALNAPIILGKPVRLAKIKKLNQLLAQWQLPPVRIEPVANKIKRRS